jgi:hypothetical protein
MSLRNYQTVTKTIITALTLSLTLGGSLPSHAQGIYIDNNCKQNQNLSESDRSTVFYKSKFVIKAQIYWFYSARYQDGAAIFCLSQPGLKQTRPLNELKPIQLNFIVSLEKDTGSKTAFIIVTREGNGSYVPMNEYRLNFAIPNKPVLTKLRTWKSKD